VSEEKDKPILDEQTLAKVLEAAYVLQEHNRELQTMEQGLDLTTEQREPAEGRAPANGEPLIQEAPATPHADYTFTLAQIVETQHQIQVRHLDLPNAMCLVVERLTHIARASGAAVAILEGNKVHYRAAAGLMTLPAGTEVSPDKALCVACLRTGQVFRCADVNPEFLLDAEECRRRGIGSLIAVPIFHDGGVGGALELYYSSAHAFAEQDVHTCQLMAGLVTEALARNEEVSRKRSPSAERAVTPDALEKLQPNKDAAARHSGTEIHTSSSTFICPKCGHDLVGEEQFCGNCGSPRSADYAAPNLQSRVASPRMREAIRKTTPAHPTDGLAVQEDSRANLERAEKSLFNSREARVPDLFAPPDLPRDQMTESSDLLEAASADFQNINSESTNSASANPENAAPVDLEIPLPAIPEDNVDIPEAANLAKLQPPPAWSSAATARDFLEQFSPAKRPSGLARFWNARRGDTYLAVAVILVACVVRWEIWSSHSVSATGNPTAAVGHRRPAPDANLSLFDRILVKVGLAEAPEPEDYKGNPETQVWVDLQTALYYCPGADLFGKTPKGKFASQRDAQLDQFEPAYRKACD
jgi:GAF domain-containing protein